MTVVLVADRDEEVRGLVTAVCSDEDPIRREDIVSQVVRLLRCPEDAHSVESIQAWFQSARAIVRFNGLSMRILDMVGPHQDRIGFMPNFSQHLLCVSFPDLDFKKLGFMWRNHDAWEGISPLWDIPTNKKAALSDAHKKLLHEIELKISALLARLHYTEYYNEPERLREIFMEIQEKTSLESWIVKWFDIVDAFMVVLREMEAGNPEFVDVYDRHLATMQGIRDGIKYPEIWGFLRGLRFDEARARIEDDFDESPETMVDFLSSFELFRIDDLAQDIRQSDSSLVFPQWYRVWKDKIDRSFKD